MHTANRTRADRWRGVALSLALVIAALAAPAVASAAPVPNVVALQAQPAADEGFEPVGQLPPQEQLPAAPMVMAAYSVVWVMIMAFVASVWRRLGKVERELRDVEQRVSNAARR